MDDAFDNQNSEKRISTSSFEEVLIASETRYRRLFESAKDGILILDAETGKIVDVNPFLIDFLGYSKNEFIEKSIWEIGAFQDIIENKDKFLELQQNEYVRYEDLPLVTSDGHEIYVEFVSNVYLVENHKVIQCQIRDITARKETEAILEKTRKELAEIEKTTEELNEFTEDIIDTVREPLLAIDKDLRVIKASRSFYNFFEVTGAETIGKLIYELGNHQWDIPKLKELLEKIIPEKNSFDNYEVEHNFSTIGKRVMLLNARQVKRAFGKEKIILLAIEDITERKGKENSLKETYRATSIFLDILLDHMHAPIIIWDTSMVIKRFNSKFELLSGYTFAEVIDKKIDILFPKEKKESTLELLKNHLDPEHLEVAEIDILTKDNKIKTVLWNSSHILDEEGNNIVATISQDITSRKRTEEALYFMETRYRRLFESAKDGILILDAETGMIVDVNPFLIELLGYSKESFIEKAIWEIGLLKDIIDNKDKFLELQQKEYVRYEDLPLETSDGRRIHVEFVSNVYLANSQKVIQCNIRDITGRKKLEANLSTAVEIAKLGYWEFDVKSRNFIFDDQYYRLIHGSSTEKQGGNIMSAEEFARRLVHPDDSKMVATSLQEAISSPDPEYLGRSETKVFRDNGDITNVMVQFKVEKDNTGRTIKVVGINQDISEQKLFEQELIQAKEKAEESDRLKSAFLANMSHEIRTPMSGILGFTNLLKEPDLTSEQKQKFIEIIQKSGDRMLNTVNDIVEISRIEAGEMKVNSNAVNMNKHLLTLSNFFKLEAEKKGLELIVEENVHKEQCSIITDKSKLSSIISNLLKNAIKYTEKGFIKIGCRKNEKFLEFNVEDSGIGIPANRIDAVFNRFEQADIKDTHVYEGSGLGLAIAKSYVEMLGGKIWVDSEENRGSVFYFTIPHISTSPDISELKKKPTIRSVEKIKNIEKILIAEDEDEVYIYLSLILNKYTDEIIRAKNGNDTVELARSNPDIQLILMDIRMPGLDGYQATKKIREFNKDVVIIAQTAYALQGDREKALAAGCNDYISKPIKRETLLKMVDKNLSSKNV